MDWMDEFPPRATYLLALSHSLVGTLLYLSVWLIILNFEVSRSGSSKSGGSGILSNLAPIVAVNSALESDERNWWHVV